ncbi:hypothetical protein [Pseudonocardia sp. MH-G8]|uniref:hypothetical protein n=1 Tax=Pseudonocardia sp. MH-G8 TaxID=1854588 RepID=UPI00117A93C4|nr:hypothetical protein [Pseudonocardia sp. MH-G8]
MLRADRLSRVRGLLLGLALGEYRQAADARWWSRYPGGEDALPPRGGSDGRSPSLLAVLREGRCCSTRRAASSRDSAAPYDESFFTEIDPGNNVGGVLVSGRPEGLSPADIERHESMFSGGVLVSLAG